MSQLDISTEDVYNMLQIKDEEIPSAESGIVGGARAEHC